MKADPAHAATSSKVGVRHIITTLRPQLLPWLPPIIYDRARTPMLLAINLCCFPSVANSWPVSALGIISAIVITQGPLCRETSHPDALTRRNGVLFDQPVAVLERIHTAAPLASRRDRPTLALSGQSPAVAVLEALEAAECVAASL